ncbi:MAG TPA: ABC transporter substrate-binding protein [Xanthobacteraceae bacterium]|jgi:putative ABC transport system substrate-binding protein|nr:ABC transporter substrate-binding protein [Xanthobacteraceae bacterium]
MTNVGILHTGAASPSAEEFLAELRNSLADFNFTEGRNVHFELRSAGGTAAKLPQQAAELVALKVDVIVAHLTPPAVAAKQATTEIPIVIAGAGDPLGTGLVASLAHPGGNVTGYSTASAEVAGKSVELIHDMFPSVRRIAVLSNETDPFSISYIAQIQQNADRAGLEALPIRLQPTAPQEPAFQTMHDKEAGAVIVQGSIMRPQTIALATQFHLPSLGSIASWPRQGGLMSYSADPSEMYHSVAEYIDKIVKGRKPADLPVALPTKFDLVVNTKTARAIGATIPESFLARASEVIE